MNLEFRINANFSSFSVNHILSLLSNLSISIEMQIVCFDKCSFHFYIFIYNISIFWKPLCCIDNGHCIAKLLGQIFVTQNLGSSSKHVFLLSPKVQFFLNDKHLVPNVKDFPPNDKHVVPNIKMFVLNVKQSECQRFCP